MKRVLEGLTLVLVGVILLLNTTGQLPWTLWWSVLGLWPLLLVAAGLDIVAKGLEAEWLRVLSALLVIAGIAVGAFVLPATGASVGFPWMGGAPSESFDLVTERPARVAEGSVTLQGGAGSYTLRSGSSRDLIRVSGSSSIGEPRVESEVAGGRADLRVRAPERTAVWMPHMGAPTSVQVALSPEVVWDVSVDTGAVDFTADLAGIELSGFQMRSGVSSATVILGDRLAVGREVPVLIRGGVSSFTLEVPRGVPVRIEAEAGLSSIDVDRSIPPSSRADRVWQSDGWGSGGYDIRFEAGVSSVKVVVR